LLGVVVTEFLTVKKGVRVTRALLADVAGLDQPVFNQPSRKIISEISSAEIWEYISDIFARYGNQPFGVTFSTAAHIYLPALYFTWGGRWNRHIFGRIAVRSELAQKLTPPKPSESAQQPGLNRRLEF
jgi:hypothetical protein